MGAVCSSWNWYVSECGGIALCIISLALCIISLGCWAAAPSVNTLHTLEVTIIALGKWLVESNSKFMQSFLMTEVKKNHCAGLVTVPPCSIQCKFLCIISLALCIISLGCWAAAPSVNTLHTLEVTIVAGCNSKFMQSFLMTVAD